MIDSFYVVTSIQTIDLKQIIQTKVSVFNVIITITNDS